MPRNTVTLEGKDSLKRALRSLSVDVEKEVIAITRETANEIRREARARIPVSTDKWAKNPYPPGTTRKKVFAKFWNKGLDAEVGNKWFVARFLEHGTVKMAARPWLFPAFAAVRPKYVQRIQAALTGVVGFHQSRGR